MSDREYTEFDETGQIGGFDKSQILLAALVVLAVVASVVMLFSNSTAAMKIAVLAALWAAFIGLFLVSKYRRMAVEERDRADLERQHFEAELRAEQATATASADTELLEEIREQLSELRAHLEQMTGRDFGFEPATLTAEASRIQEIEAAAYDIAQRRQEETHPETAEAEAVVFPPSTLDDEPDEPAVDVSEVEDMFLDPAEETSVDIASDNSEAKTRQFSTPTFGSVPNYSPSQGLVNEKRKKEPAEPKRDSSGAKRFDTGSFAAVRLDIPAEEEDQESRHGRRRRDERSSSVSVAELLANLKKNQ